MARLIDLSKNIPGWGSDLPAERRPGIPREHHPDNTGAHWNEPEKQEPTVKIHVSVERPGITPVFGTASPPRGLSGKLRDLAYGYGEARLAHWLTLLAADRIDIVEGLIADAFQGKLPHPFAEIGLIAEVKSRSKSLRKRLPEKSELLSRAKTGVRESISSATGLVAGVGAAAYVTTQALIPKRLKVRSTRQTETKAAA